LDEHNVAQCRLREVGDSDPHGVVTAPANPLMFDGVVQIGRDIAHGNPVLVGFWSG
jgi:hypothetical protein